MTRVLAFLSIVCACCLFVADTQAQKVMVGPSATVSSSEAAEHPWYEVHVDPDDANNVIICGTKWDAKNNGPYGFVYYSGDGGKSWTLALEDKSSKFVTEQSCAYGVGGVAYFVSDASRVIDDFPQHSLGTTRIFTSRDSGRTWRVGVKTGWTDYSTSVVDTGPGPDQNRLYVFFHELSGFYNSIGQKENADAELDGMKKGSIGTRIGLISYKDGDLEVRGPFSNPEIGKEKNQGAYPAPAFLLKGGSILTLYTTKHKDDKGTYRFTAETVRTSADRSGLERPVQVAEVFDDTLSERYHRDCDLFLDAAGAYDPIHDKLYFLYPRLRDNTCDLFLTTSTDGGQSWADAWPLSSPDETPVSIYANPTLAVSGEGVLAVMWQRKPQSGCWMFAISEDGGLSLSRAKELGTCSGDAQNSTALSTAYLWTAIYQADSTHKEGFKAGSARIILRNRRNAVSRNIAMAVSPDGVFHPVWVDGGNNGELRTAAVHVTSAAVLIASETKGLADVTNKLAILYGGNQSYDAQSGIVTVDITIRNKTAEAIRGPFKLAVASLSKDYGYADIANADNGATAGGTVWDISSSVPDGTLGPGAISKPFSLKFRYHPDSNERPLLAGEDFLDLTVKVFADIQDTSENHK